MKDYSMLRPTWAEVDLKALANNLSYIESLVPNAKICAMVKANAYGHGSVEISKKLEKLNVSFLGVATVEEGRELRLSGIKTRVLVFGGLLGVGKNAGIVAVENNLTPVVHTVDILKNLSDASSDNKIKIHVKIDTGMGRLGIRPEMLDVFLNEISKYNNIEVEGVITHLASADCKEYSNSQIQKFIQIKEKIKSKINNIKYWHFASSAWVLSNAEKSGIDGENCLIRPGLALYGIGNENLFPVMSLKSKVALIKHISKGDSVGYGCTWKADENSRIAVIPIGYADGYPWKCSNKSHVIVRGKRVPVIGRVSMDLITVDITKMPECSVGDIVTLIGKDGSENIQADEIARLSETISYEIISLISPRVPRIYKE